MTIAAEVFTPTARVEQAFQRIEEVDRPEVWITLRRKEDVLADAASVEARLLTTSCTFVTCSERVLICINACAVY